MGRSVQENVMTARCWLLLCGAILVLLVGPTRAVPGVAQSPGLGSSLTPMPHEPPCPRKSETLALVITPTPGPTTIHAGTIDPGTGATLQAFRARVDLRMDRRDRIAREASEEPIKIHTGATGWTTIMTEDFEGDFPGSWDVFDNADGYGEYYWAKRNCRRHSGSYSGWGVGGGANGGTLSCGANYPDNAYACMIHGPFDLSNATDAELLFWYWNLSESDNDYVRWGASIDGSYFYGDGDDGDSGGWAYVNFDLTSVYVLGNLTGEPEVWIAFIFMGEGSITYPEGAYVDDVTLRAFTAVPTPTPTSTPTPSPTPTATPTPTPTVTSTPAPSFISLPLVIKSHRTDTYEPNDSQEQAYGPLVSGTTYRSYIWFPDDDDWYYIEVSALDTISIDLEVPLVTDYDLYLYDSRGTNILAKSDSFGNGVAERIEYMPDRTGKYYIRVYPYEGYSNTESYSLVVIYH